MSGIERTPEDVARFSADMKRIAARYVDEDGDVLDACECDNTHEQNGTVCRWCWHNGRRKPSDPEVA